MRQFIYILIFVIASSSSLMAKNQNGDSFGIAPESYFPQEEDLDKYLNGLQVASRPLFGEPFYSDDYYSYGKSILSSINDNYKTVLSVYPGHKISSPNIFKLDSSLPHSWKTEKSVWSYHAAPTKDGGVSYRYLDPAFQKLTKWEDLYEEYERHPPLFLINESKVDTLSPIEKYEYLIGNTSFNLTKGEWLDGKGYLDRYGQIPDWIGICHGTAPATIKNLRPKHAIKLKSFDNRNDITFYPSDIKQLISYSWARAGSHSAILGTRCSSIILFDGRPPFDCVDVNPGAFHLAVLNLLGGNDRPFIVDSYAGNQVWNRPVISYQYKYFKPGTHNTTERLQSAIVSRSDFKNDKHAMYRSKNSIFVVGIWLELTYVIGTKPSNNRENTPLEDNFEKVSFWYDLELNQEGDIIGGEWNSQNHPDFLWVIDNTSWPKTFYDSVIGSGLDLFDGTKPLPETIKGYAKLTAQKNQILYTIIDRMINLSQIKN